MNEKIRQERSEKLKKVIDAAVAHLENGLSALEDANLYTNDVQESVVDTLVERLENLISTARHNLP